MPARYISTPNSMEELFEGFRQQFNEFNQAFNKELRHEETEEKRFLFNDAETQEVIEQICSKLLELPEKYIGNVNLNNMTTTSHKQEQQRMTMSDLMTLRDNLVKSAEEQEKRRQETRGEKQTKKLTKSTIDSKLVDLKKEIDELMTENRAMEQQLQEATSKVTNSAR